MLPGLIDLHVHLPQLPNAGVGAGLHLLDWLERYIFPLERAYDRSVAERQAPAAWRAFAAAGTTTVLAYAALWPDSTDAAFAAAAAGAGIARIVSYLVEEQIESRVLVRVLEGFELTPRPLSLIYPGQRLVPTKLRAFLDFATPRLREKLGYK